MNLQSAGMKVKLLEEMRDMSLSPDVITYTSIVKSFVSWSLRSVVFLLSNLWFVEVDSMHLLPLSQAKAPMRKPLSGYNAWHVSKFGMQGVRWWGMVCT